MQAAFPNEDLFPKRGAELKYTVDTMQQGIYRDSVQAERLKYDLDSIERFGRENYYMKAPNEDVFVVTREEN